MAVPIRPPLYGHPHVATPMWPPPYGHPHMAAPHMAAPNMVNVTVPDGAFAGDMFTARMPNGQLAQCEVPPGAGPGAVITVNAPS